MPDHMSVLQAGGDFGFQTYKPLEWLFIAGAFIVLSTSVALLMARGSTHVAGIRSLLVRIGEGVERFTGMPAWSGAARLVGAWALAVALLGFVWDVAWHTDLGRDRVLFTVPHTLILVGLAGIGFSGVVSIVYATLQPADVAWRIGRVRIPAGAAVLLLLSAGALVAFPLDDWWHATYGIDVTMWSPTHLLMIGSASLAPMALALIAWESPGRDNARRRFQESIICGALLVGVSTFQLEFDMGVPQWQALFQPVLIAAATGFGLVASRVLLGRWGAVRAVLVFLALRGIIAVVVGPGLGRTVPHFPLYVVEAACVEIAFAVARTPLLRALLSGGLIGTAGLAAEWAWSQVWGWQPWNVNLVPHMWVAALVAVSAALLAMAFGAALRRAREPGQTTVPRSVVAGAAAATLALLLVPLPRDASSATAVITTHPTGVTQAATTRDGQTATVRDYAVRVDVTPADAATGADWFRVAAWQGGAVIDLALRQIGPGSYVTDEPVPVGGDWKSMVYLARGSIMAAAPISMPAEPDQGLVLIPLLHQRTAQLASAQLLLIREAHDGGPAVAAVAYGFFAAAAVAWMLAIALGARRVARPKAPPRRTSAEQRAAPPRVAAGAHR